MPCVSFCADASGERRERQQRAMDGAAAAAAYPDDLQDVVLDRPGEEVGCDALLLGRNDVHGHHRQHGAVHRHAHAHLVEGDAVKEHLMGDRERGEGHRMCSGRGPKGRG